MNTISKLTLLSLALLSPALSAQPVSDAPLQTPAIAGITEAGASIALLASGREGSEGPLPLADGSVLFTEARANRIVRIGPDLQLSTFKENTGGANALALSPSGEIVAVLQTPPRVGVVHPDAQQAVFAEGYADKPFTRPNDITRASDGTVFFTDSAQNHTEASHGPAVYRIATDGSVQQLTTAIARPNGITLSKDERTLFVANTLGAHVFALALNTDGSVGEPREFAELAGWKAEEGSSGADGLAVDDEGRLYVTSFAGIEVFDTEGTALGVIPLPVKPQNIAFGGADKSWLYVVGAGSAYRFAVLTPGLATRAK